MPKFDDLEVAGASVLQDTTVDDLTINDSVVLGSSPEYWRTQPLALIAQGSPNRWTFTTIWIQSDKTDPGSLVFSLSNLIDGAVLTQVDVWVDGAGHSDLPGTMPDIELIRSVHNSGSNTSIGAATDSSGSFGAYDSPHAISITGLSEAIEESNSSTASYYVIVNGEAGANSQNNGLRILGISARFTVSELRPGG